MNVYDKPVESRFIPLPLEGLFQVGQQFKQNELAAEQLSQEILDQYNVPVLPQDREKRNAKIAEMEAKIAELNPMFKSDPMGALPKAMLLKKQAQKELTRGSLHAYASNYQAAQEYLKNKDLFIDAKWDPQRADQFIQEQIKGFEGTEFDPSTENYNQFHGELLPNYISTRTWLGEELARIKPETQSWYSGLSAAEKQAIQLNGLETAMKKNMITGISAQKIYDSLSEKAAGDTELRRSLEAEWMLAGKPGQNWGNIFEYDEEGNPVYNLDKKGNPISRKHVASPFEQALLGTAEQGSYQDYDSDIKVRTNEELKIQYEAQADRITQGLNNILRPSLGVDISTQHLEDYQTVLTEASQNLQKLEGDYKAAIEAKNPDGTPKYSEDVLLEMKAEHLNAQSIYNNTKATMEALQQEVDPTLSKQDQSVIKHFEENGIEDVNSPKAMAFMLAKLWGESDTDGFIYVGPAGQNEANSLTAREKEERSNLYVHLGDLQRQLLMGRLTSKEDKRKVLGLYNTEILGYGEIGNRAPTQIEQAYENRNRKVVKYVEQNPIAHQGTAVHAPDSGPSATPIGIQNKNVTLDFAATKGLGWSDALTGMPITDILAEDLDDILTEGTKSPFNIANDETLATGFNMVIVPDALDLNGDPVYELTVYGYGTKGKTGTTEVPVKTFRVSKGPRGNADLKVVADELMNSTDQDKHRLGVVANANYQYGKVLGGRPLETINAPFTMAVRSKYNNQMLKVVPEPTVPGAKKAWKVVDSNGEPYLTQTVVVNGKEEVKPLIIGSQEQLVLELQATQAFHETYQQVKKQLMESGVESEKATKFAEEQASLRYYSLKPQ
jgi:hypothetical protein